MSSFQTTIIVGNAGGNAEMRYMPDGTPVVNVSVAINEKFGDKETTTWHRVAFWGNLTNGAQHIIKGQTVAVEGRPSVETWTDKDGQFRAGLKLTANTFRFIGGRPDGAPAASADAAQTPEDIADEIPF